MLKFALVVLLPLSIIFYRAYAPYITGSSGDKASQKTGTLEKLIVENGTVMLDIDVSKLNSGKFGSNAPRTESIRFDVAADSFFSIKVFNGELRGPMPGTLRLAGANRVELPTKLAASLENLVLEKAAWGDYE